MVQPSDSGQVTEDEYLDRERQAETKSELVNGEIVAMAGGSP
jgi:Uma2 family endonuclease